jgi:hypothetical protein
MSQNYQIMRTAKLTSNGNVGASIAHAFRARETPNADMERTPKNQHIGAKSLEEAMAKYRELLPEKSRSNAVRCIEYVITASPEAYKKLKGKEWTKYINEGLKWINEKHGKGCFYACYHQDETTPHLSVYVVPLDEKGHLNARSFLGGRAKLSAMQTDFHEKVSKNFGLDRGLMGSKAKHMTIKDYYGKMAELEKAIEPPKRKLLEKEEDYAERYKAQLRPLLKMAIEASQVQERNIQLEDHVAMSKKGFKEYTSLTQGLTPDQVKNLNSLVNQWKRENEQKKELERQQTREKANERGKDNDRGFSR